MKKFYTIFILLLTLTTGSFAQQISDDVNTVEVAIKVVRFFPNPASSVISFDFTGIDKSYILQIYNFLGKKMSDDQITNNRLTYNLDNYYRGLYIFQVRDRGGNIVESGKFQVIK